MSRWSWFTPAPRQPVPADGLAVDRFGDTWWGQEWIRSLLRLGRGYSNRLPRGRSYARAGRVIDLEMGAGEVTARVVGTRSRPYRVRITLEVLDEAAWMRVVELVAGRARFVAALLRGELPPELGEALMGAGIELFPAGPGQLATECSCPDWANPCKHVAAVHYVVAAALDMDPFLIFVLRGLGKAALLAALAKARGAPPPDPGLPLGMPEAKPESLWESAEDTPDEAAYLGLDTPLPQLAFEIRPSGVDLAGLAQLGPPPPALQGLPGALGPAIRRAAKAALALAQTLEGQTESLEDETAIREGVLAFLRGRPEGATLLLMRSRLPYGKQPLARAVHALRREGALSAEGHGAALKYRIPSRVPGRSPQPRRATRNGTRRSRTSATSGKSVRPDTATPGDLTERILAVLGEARRPLPLREIAERLGHPADTRLRAAMTRLRAGGAVTMLGARRGARYKLAARGSPRRRRRS